MEHFHDKLKVKIHCYVKLIYKLTKTFSKEELYGVTSQIRRSALSIMLNYIEGYARRKKDNCKVYKNFLEISYGLLKESKYLLFLSNEGKYITKDEYESGLFLTDEIGRMLWSIIKTL